jgi:hypothetical protein
VASPTAYHPTKWGQSSLRIDINSSSRRSKIQIIFSSRHTNFSCLLLHGRCIEPLHEETIANSVLMTPSRKLHHWSTPVFKVSVNIGFYIKHICSSSSGSAWCPTSIDDEKPCYFVLARSTNILERWCWKYQTFFH